MEGEEKLQALEERKAMGAAFVKKVNSLPVPRVEMNRHLTYHSYLPLLLSVEPCHLCQLVRVKDVSARGDFRETTSGPSPATSLPSPVLSTTAS